MWYVFGKQNVQLKRPLLFHPAETRISFSYMISCVTSSANYDKLKIVSLVQFSPLCSVH